MIKNIFLTEEQLELLEENDSIKIKYPFLNSSSNEVHDNNITKLGKTYKDELGVVYTCEFLEEDIVKVEQTSQLLDVISINYIQEKDCNYWLIELNKIYSFSIPIIVNVTVTNIEDAEEIAHDLKEILDDNGFTNSVELTDEISF